MEIVRPDETHLLSYTEALKRAIALGTIKIERAQGKVIDKNEGVLFERFVQHQAYGGVDGLKFRIYL